MRNESAIKICSDEMNPVTHNCNLEIDFISATSNGFPVKSAYELAMERLQKGSPSVTLTAEQKAQLAEVDSSFNAKIAERKIFLSDQLTKAVNAGKFDEVESLEKQLTSDVLRLQEECESKKEKLRASFMA